jgi:hypothetical protein
LAFGFDPLPTFTPSQGMAEATWPRIAQVFLIYPNYENNA